MNKYLKEIVAETKETGDLVTEKTKDTKMSKKARFQALADKLKDKAVVMFSEHHDSESWLASVLVASVASAMVALEKTEGRLWGLYQRLPDTYKALSERLNLDPDDVEYLGRLKGAFVMDIVVPVAQSVGFVLSGYKGSGTCSGYFTVPGFEPKPVYTLPEIPKAKSE